MARLNEAPPPAESVDQLKRRFIRQNRELAKNNSAQSVRIRALETEQARLLAENLSLREQIIQLQTELEHNKDHNAVQQITSVKDKLESKLLEIGGLVAELNSIHKPSSKARLSEAAPSRATEHFEWRRAMKEQAGEQDDDEILPTIREDKYFPRRTLEYVDTTHPCEGTVLIGSSTEELRAVLTDAAEESPDLGPPPVAHFTDEDPIKFDPKPAIEDENDDMEVDQKDEEPLPATLSVNLETRKKRRDSSKLDLRKMSVFQSPGEDDTARASESEDSQPSKMGKKRKLSATAEDTNGEAGEKDYRDDFRFSRRSGDRDNRQPLETSHKQNTKLDPTMAAERKALGDKTNTSPKKVQKSDSKSDPKSGIKKLEFPKETARNRVRERKSRSSMVKIAPAETNGIVETVDVEIEEPEQPGLPPKTPAGLDLFSPASTEPSAARQESRDTPPPGDLGSSNSDATAGGRPSRRARSQVNYAEPSLVSKMRRPDKKLADAVVDSRRSLDPQPDQSHSGPNSSNAMRTVVIKKERTDDQNSAWKSLPASSEQHEPHSPLSNKTAAAQLASESQTKEPESNDPRQADEKPTKSATAVKDLLASSTNGASRRRTTAKSSSNDSVAAAERKDRPDLAIFDFNVTDPSPADDSDAPSTNGTNAEQIMKSSRALAAKTAAASSRRHSSIISTKDRESSSGGPAPSKTVSFSDESGRSKATRDLRQAKSSSTAGSAATAPEGRSERSSARRRSMML
ncbi:hypothetical protein SLS56_006074 [Neofusicoccum ribis]|uniref:Shugoshin n=1 Tax=Neofusicoccum ribis TaxID=45134 RepID=A0ABR3SSF0_9PEZI